MCASEASSIIDLLKNKLIEKDCVKEVSKEFSKIKDNAEKVKFLESQLIEYDLMPKDQFKDEKDEKIAIDLRVTGNEKYVNRNFLQALECYNKSLCYSPSANQNIGIIYANRSAVYFQLKVYDKCLDDIQRALKNNYKDPDKLKIRELKCHERMSSCKKNMTQAIGKSFFKLSYNPNPKVPFIADSLELKSSTDFGRYVVAKKNLSAGEIIAIEEPFSKCLLKNQNYKYCCNCLDDNCLSLIPCDSCTQAMFCSEKCLREGMMKFHRFECSIVNKFNELSSKMIKIGIYTFFEALDIFKSNILDLMNVINEISDSPTTVFDHDLNVEGTIKKTRLLATINSLMTNEENRSLSDLFNRSGTVAIVTNLFLNHTKLSSILNTCESQDFFRNFIFKQVQIAAINYHGIFDGVMDKSQLNQNLSQYASASFPFCSLLNHSCAPNIVRISYKTKNYVMVNRPIKKNEQLFDNYGYHHCLEDLAQRQNGLSCQYMFKCCCEACTKNYPLYPDLPSNLNYFDELRDDIDDLTNLKIETARKRLMIYCNYINKFDDNYPCNEISTLQECLLRCYFIFKLSPFMLKLLEE